ncbi:DNA-binding SARP family transcriptional activator [Allocatelliglobosispora scoriae]|uniref:DNA-binding SARP family transcriptional activator n=1 Tax=Allocatelliglobosispora scoriae TaxID=643052 RepID=A0A841BMP1_9ACTN|nr:AfsR/SARP family transcriptional regulator [Allocatelliglobosispora scoriae]MBB5868648.1 DNA-binding SARP family transcriptional activator [Allocatelliglobosispora scoriae]
MTTFRVLGPLAAHRDGTAVPLAPSLRRLLAVFLSRPNRPIPGPALVEELWAGRTPANAHKVMQVYVHRLRRTLVDESLIGHGASGYVLRVAEGDLDSLRFGAMVERAEVAFRRGELAKAAELLAGGLALWSGDPFADARDTPAVEDESRRLIEARVRAHEIHGDVLLALGRHVEAVTDLVALTRSLPMRERLRGQAMLALHRCGRRAEALELFRECRATLAEQLGIEPGAELQILHRAILRGDPVFGGRVAAPPRNVWQHGADRRGGGQVARWEAAAPPAKRGFLRRAG